MSGKTSASLSGVRLRGVQQHLPERADVVGEPEVVAHRNTGARRSVKAAMPSLKSSALCSSEIASTAYW